LLYYPESGISKIIFYRRFGQGKAAEEHNPEPKSENFTAPAKAETAMGEKKGGKIPNRQKKDHAFTSRPGGKRPDLRPGARKK